MPGRFSIGQTHRARFEVDASAIERFAELSGDRNPIHVDAEEARTYGYPRPVVPGAMLVAFLSQIVGMEIPGPGAVWMSQSVEWVNPVLLGDEIDFLVTVKAVSAGAGILTLDTVATNQRGGIVMRGEAKVKITEKLTGMDPGPGDTTRVALVTGGSRGMGAAIARQLAARGMSVAVNYRDSLRSAEGVVEEITSAGGSAQAFSADVGDPEVASNMVREVINSFGRLDVVVHGASPSIRPAKVAEVRYEDIEPYLRVYLGGAQTLVAGALPGMTARKFGRFVFIGTAHMLGIPPAGLAPYLAAKQALWGFVRCMAAELGPVGITSNMVSPGVTVTDLTAGIPARLKELEARKSPMRRLATTQDTALLVAFLASDAAGYINGANLPVTGGPV